VLLLIRLEASSARAAVTSALIARLTGSISLIVGFWCKAFANVSSCLKRVLHRSLIMACAVLVALASKHAKRLQASTTPYMPELYLPLTSMCPINSN
jgi:hypothetical protein